MNWQSIHLRNPYLVPRPSHRPVFDRFAVQYAKNRRGSIHRPVLIACSMQKKTEKEALGEAYQKLDGGKAWERGLYPARNGPRGILCKRPPPSNKQNSGRRLLKWKASRYLVPVHTQYDISWSKGVECLQQDALCSCSMRVQLWPSWYNRCFHKQLIPLKILQRTGFYSCRPVRGHIHDHVVPRYVAWLPLPLSPYTDNKTIIADIRNIMSDSPVCFPGKQQNGRYKNLCTRAELPYN